MERKVEEAGKNGLAGMFVCLYHCYVPRITLAAKGEVLNCCTCKPFWGVIFRCCFITVLVNLKSATQTLSSKKVRTVIFFSCRLLCRLSIPPAVRYNDTEI